MAETKGTYANDPLFDELMEDVQNGEWQSGFDKIEELKLRYPDAPSIDELQELQQEIKLKSTFDEKEEEEEKRVLRNRILRWTMGVLLVVGLALGVYASSSWLQKQFVSVRINLLTEVQSVEAAVHYRDAQSYVEADRPQEAQSALQKVIESNPDYPGVAELEKEVSGMLEVEREYQNALEHMGSEKYEEALMAFEEIAQKHPNYKDVNAKIQEAQKDLLLDRLLTEAEIAYQDENWEIAIQRYESVQALASKFNSDALRDRLVESYINAAQKELDERPESFEALKTAKDYFQKALIIRPMDEDILIARRRAISSQEERIYKLYLEKAQEALVNQEDSLLALTKAKGYYQRAASLVPGDPRAKTQLAFARKYLDAEDDFSLGKWSETIEALEDIYVEQPGYAAGTARQMLYDAYLQRGDKRKASGDYEESLSDYKRAAEIANEKPEGGTIRLYWAKIKIAEVLGIQGEYQQAVQLYTDAVNLTNLLSLARASEGNSEIIIRLQEAERYANLNWWGSAFRTYNRVLPATEVLYTVEEYTVQEGDYLSQLAKQYETVTLSILSQNNITSPSSVDKGQTILIPTIREPGQ